MARRARGFGMEIHYHDQARLPPELEQGATYHATLESLLARSQFLSLHAPGGEGTRHLLNERTLGLLPEGAVVVNTARGTLVDDKALLAALRSGRLFAAGLDVFANEPALDPGYLECANCFLLPHTWEAPRSRPGTGWASAASTTSTRSSRGRGRRTRWWSRPNPYPFATPRLGRGGQGGCAPLLVTGFLGPSVKAGRQCAGRSGGHPSARIGLGDYSPRRCGTCRQRPTSSRSRARSPSASRPGRRPAARPP